MQLQKKNIARWSERECRHVAWHIFFETLGKRLKVLDAKQ
jgi:hypothetical protein